MIGYQDKINQILRGAETIKNMNDDIDEKEFEFDIFREINQLRDAAEELEEVKLERDALWVKTQEDEREINDLRDVNKQLREEIEKLKELHTLNFMSDMLPMEKLQKQRDELKKRVKMLEDIIAKHTSIPRAVIPKLTTKFPEIVQSEITPVPKE